MKVSEKLRSGASVPSSPAQTTTPSRKTPSAPGEHLGHRVDEQRARASRETGRQFRPRSAVVCQATESAKNETIRTSDAPQANSHAGIGRSWRPTSAWPTTSGEPRESITHGLTVISAICVGRLLELDLEHPLDRRRDVERRPSRRP